MTTTTVYSFTFAVGTGVDGWAAAAGTYFDVTPDADGAYSYDSGGGSSASIYKTVTGLTPGIPHTFTALVNPDGPPGMTASVDGVGTGSPATGWGSTTTLSFTPTGTSHVLRVGTGAASGGYVKTVTVDRVDPPPPAFKPGDALRLEVESDPDGLVNLVQNPSGELGGWGWVTPVAGRAMYGSRQGDGLYWLQYVNNGTGGVSSYFYTEPLPVAAGQYAAASWTQQGGSGYTRPTFEWLDSAQALLSSSAQGGYSAAGATAVTVNYGPYQAPAGAAYVRLRLDHYSNTSGGYPASGTSFWLRQATVAKAETSGALGTVRTNLVPNPSFEANTAGWSPSSLTSLTRVTTQAYVGTASASISAFEGGSLYARYNGIAVTGGLDYTLSAYVKASSVNRTARVVIWWFDSGGSLILQTIGNSSATSTATWNRFSVTATAPSNAATVAAYVYVLGVGGNEPHYIDAVLFEQASAPPGSYFDGATAAGGGWTYAWTGAAHASTSTATSSNLAYVEPVPYLNVLGESHEITVSREALNVGTMQAEVLSSTLDPSQSPLIRPGRRCRLLALDGSDWEPLFTGRLSEATVKYELKDPRVPDEKRARITLTAVDAAATLANTSRPEGVAEVSDLPWVLEGCGVPWSCDGFTSQVPAAVVASINENASALDQVALTRDSELGYAWVDRRGVLQAWAYGYTGSYVSANWNGTLDESDYTDLDVSFSTRDCVNEVRVKLLSASGASTEETPYGPYRDAASIEEWGVFSAEFTVHGLTSTEVDALATQILAQNGTPQLRVNSLRLAVASASDVGGRALIDLYDFPQVVNTAKGISDYLYVTGVRHSITPDKWTVELEFGGAEGVASPTMQPPVQTGARPDVGKVEMFAGPSSAVPAGHLLCDGSSKLVADYPYLHAVIGYTHGGSGASFNVPDLVDKFPIGAGTKALGTSGGGPTKTIGTANLPPHQHTINHDHPSLTLPLEYNTTTATGGSATRITDIGNTTGGTGTNADATINILSYSGSSGNGPGSSTPLDVMNPWRALNFIIRAV